MKIQTKISLATALVLLVLFGVHSVISYRQVKNDITEQLLEEATNVRGILMATRRIQHKQFLSSGLPVNEKTVGFLPAHSLSRIAKDFPNWADSGLYFNGVSDRPRNPDNQADASELAAMDWFRANPKAERRVAELTGADGKSYFHFASPLYIEAYCLICHGERAAAPPSIRDMYNEAYGYKLGDLRGVLSIKIPMARLEAKGWSVWRSEMRFALVGYVVLFLVLGFLTDRLVTRRLARLEKTAGALAVGDYSQRSRQNGSDEVSSLASAIDQMAEAVQVRDGELLEREKKLSVILAAAPVGVGVSVDRVIVEANDTLCKLLNYSRDEMKGLSSRDLYPDPAEADRVRRLRDAQFSVNELCIVETRWRTRDGRVLDILLSISPLVPGDVSAGTVFAVLDISDRKKYEQQLEESQAQLEAQVAQRTADLSAALDAAKVADQAKDAFLANVSHELRTPLNAVIGLSSLARRTSNDPQQQDQLNKVISAGKTLAGLINDLLDLSKIVAGRMELEVATFSLRGVVHRCNSVISYRAAEKGLKLVEQIDEACPDALIGDPLRFEQILINLLSNAVKFTTAGQVEIRVRLQPGAEPRIGHKVHLVIEVEDTGMGMSDVQIAQLFRPFIQVDASMSRKFGGTGLGLAICKNLVEMMGGEISVRSREGQGSIFCVGLCVDQGNPEDIPVPEALTGEEMLRYRDVKILVVEDQPLNREIVEALLKLVGIGSRMAANGQEALEILADSGPETFDLVLMDIQMPLMDGLTATRLLRSWPGFELLPVIAMTAHTMTHEKAQSAEVGMNDHIGKPFDNAIFYRTLARWIPAAKQQGQSSPPESAESAESAGAPSDTGFPAMNGIDTAGGLSRLAGNETRYRHWLNEFIAEGPANAQQIRQALASGNNEAARQIAHAFKGRVGMLGMNDLHVVASALEAALKQGNPVEGWLGKLEESIEQTSHAIKNALGPQVEAPSPLVPAPEAPQGPVPDAVAHLIELLNASDGGSAAAIARALVTLQGSAWAPRLQQALGHAQNFDFVAAANALSA